MYNVLYCIVLYSIVLCSNVKYIQVLYWDVRGGCDPVGMIKLSESHSEPVFNTVWTASKTNSEIMTASCDGIVRWWDTRNFNTAVHTVDLQAGNNTKGRMGPCSPSTLEYEATIPARYMVGTEQGKVLCCDRKAKDNAEVILSTYEGHWGPIRALQRNPCFPKNFLTVGDWSMKIWSDDVIGSPLFWVWSGQEIITAASWSPARPSVIFATRLDGFLMVSMIIPALVNTGLIRYWMFCTSKMVLYWR